MSDLERRLELSLAAAEGKSRKLVKKLAKELRVAEDRLRRAHELLVNRREARDSARNELTEATKRAVEDEARERLKGRIEYNHKVRNR
jgi:hypothetical protein